MFRVKKNERIELPITNERTRQIYYGAIDIHTKEFVLSAFDKAGGGHTTAFVKQLKELRDGKKLLLIWDQAGYHRYSDMKKYLKR